ncbi:MAG: shikimate dehydrogenase [Flavobacteriales bacterium]|jgi:shikimate dehydrogenase|nr:shikimate dehydrogenase [Flavobacteriales bacterium]|tara:strand:- start:857 stop:1597 length:741 start_codon:yes stop_codon:yes gene_type:complete
MYKLGLLGTPLTHSFSKKYFDYKFQTENINNFKYDLYDFKQIHKIWNQSLIGLNITLPYKINIINYLDKLDVISKEVQSVNTVCIHPFSKEKIGYNTDVIGFEKLLLNFNIKSNKSALILGSGGVSNTVKYILKKYQIQYLIASRTPTQKMIQYNSIKNIIKDCQLIINTTPLGQFPNTSTYPQIPYNLITKKHQCIDLVYNPQQTIFLNKCKAKGAEVIGGIEMFNLQAEAAWKIWTQFIKKNNV